MAPRVPSLARLTLRDLLHFLVPFVTALVTFWRANGSPIDRSALYALAPGLAAVVFRQLFPNVNVTAGEINVGIKLLADTVTRLEAQTQPNSNGPVPPPPLAVLPPSAPPIPPLA